MRALLSGSLFCRLCLSITDFHPDTWNPAWSVSTILTGLLSFMVEKGPTLGSIETSDFTVRGEGRGGQGGLLPVFLCPKHLGETPALGPLILGQASWAAPQTWRVLHAVTAPAPCGRLVFVFVFTWGSASLSLVGDEGDGDRPL